MVGSTGNDVQKSQYAVAPGDEILITGISGNFPDSDSVKEFGDNLFNKMDLVSDDDRRWKLNHPEIPQRTGKINNVTKFDAAFFGVNYKQAHCMDPNSRVLMEKTYEALIDAGINPEELRNTNTGVFVGSSFAESEKTCFYEKMQTNEYGTTGCNRGMLASRVSAWLGLAGPSYVVDTACSSSLYAVEHAYKSILEGHCDAAIVGCSNLCLHPNVSLQFFRMGVLSSDGKCKSLDRGANGYVRAEAIAVCFLQRARDSRRVYAQVVHAKTNCDGYKEQGISYPAGDVQKVLLHKFYEECGVQPTTVEYVEAHATGTKVGDPEEMMAIDEVFCRERPEPLLIGCVKSNMGHSEPSSGMCSIAKVIVAYNTGYIPPNINFNNPRTDIPVLLEGRIKVITDKMPWNRGLTGINSFGFGGANAHVLLKKFSREKVNNGMPSDDLPRLVCVSGRTEPAVHKILKDLQSKPVDAEEVRLWHAIHSKDISGHPFRGFVLLGSTPTKSVTLSHDVQQYTKSNRTLWFVYPGVNALTPGLVSQLLKITVFAQAIKKCHTALVSKGVNLIKIISDPNPEENLLYSLLTTVSVHIGLTDVLKAVGVQPDRIFGYDVGKMACAYADGILTAEQVILAAYSVGLASTETPINSDPELLQYLKDVMPLLEANAERWSSEPKSDAIVIELAPIDQTWNQNRNVISITLTKKNHDDPISVLFTALGKIFELGVSLELASLYPAVAFPVSLGTPMLAHLVEWQHCDDWFVAKYGRLQPLKLTERTVELSLKEDEFEYISGHCIDGRTIVPGTLYLVLAWETLSLILHRSYTDVSVVFEDVSLSRLTYMPAEGTVEFVITILSKSGDFELVENGTTVAKGRIRVQENIGKDFRVVPPVLDDDDDDDIIIDTKDFYKELHLRGYEYKGVFRGVLNRNLSGTKARLAWINNWVTFLDNMLQMKACGDSRALNVPVRIDRLAIDVDVHNAALAKHNTEEKSLELRAYHEIDTIRCGGAEMCGMHMTAIPKKLPNGIPVFEKNEFIPNYTSEKMALEDILRADFQLVHENIQTYKFKSIELVDEEYKSNKLEPLIEKAADILADMPLVQTELVVMTDDSLDLPDNVTVLNKKIVGESNAIVFIGANLLQRPDVLQQALGTLKEGCFVISREVVPPNPKDFYITDYSIVTIHNTGNESIVLLRRKPDPKPTKFIKIVTADQTYSWINEVKEEMKEGQKLVLYSQGESVNGLLGLVNCLRREPGGETVSGILIGDPKAPKFKPDLKFYKDQLDMDLGINVYLNGEWGTYRHLLLEDLKTIQTNHAYVNTTTIGDLSSLRWLEGSLKENATGHYPGKALIHVYSSAMNFRDVMTASGRVSLDAVARGRIAQECVQGIEVSGRTVNGSRVMAVCQKGISNLVMSDQSLMWSFPDEWSFDEAVTVPVAYSTVYLALMMIGKIKSGDKILIHAGTGGVGQAAINVAMHCGCEVFTTVGTPYKRAFIKKMFPQIKDSHIGNSRDTSFEDMIRRETNGRGVDLVLNSLADEKLLASIKCLCRGGRFLEIGKYDITNNSIIQMYMFKNGISFHGVMLDYIYDDESIMLRKTLQELLVAGIESGAVRPVTYITFEKDEIERAYRYMAAGKHIGKIIIKIREEDKGSVKPKLTPVIAVPRYACDENHVYVLVGGLGGFGVELADWLMLRGAKKLILNSRRGISNGYQKMRLKAWESYGVDAKVSTHDVTTESGCKKLLEMANSMGTVSAIFNLAVILKDAVFTNQTPEMFQTSFGPKAQATMNLDQLSRQMCPELRDFVIFSSVSCGRGNAGQTNYGFSNSVMERICEERKKVGLPALAIQWGAIGDVGLVADMQEENVQIEIGGTLQQRISSCLQAMDKFLKLDATIVSSIVVAEKRSGGGASSNALEVVAQILGVGDLKTVSQQAVLAELGLDSIMAVEIKQTLEREFEIFLTAQEIRNLTFARLTELTAKTGTQTTTATSAPKATGRAGLEVIMRNFGDETQASVPFMYLPSKATNGTKTQTVDIREDVLFMLPGLESSAAVLAPLCARLNANTCVLQLGLEQQRDNLQLMVDRLYKSVKPRLAAGAPFRLLGYSFGSLPILELAAKLESEGHKGVVICLDGAPDVSFNLMTNLLSYTNDSELQDSLIIHTLKMAAPDHDISELAKDKLSSMTSVEERIAGALKLSPVKFQYSAEFLTAMTTAAFDRLKALINFKDISKKLTSPIVLLRPSVNPSYLVHEENYGLNKYTESGVTVHKFDSDHISILENDECANVINKLLAEYSESRKTDLNRRLGN